MTIHQQIQHVGFFQFVAIAILVAILIFAMSLNRVCFYFFSVSFLCSIVNFALSLVGKYLKKRVNDIKILKYLNNLDL